MSNTSVLQNIFHHSYDKPTTKKRSFLERKTEELNSSIATTLSVGNLKTLLTTDGNLQPLIQAQANLKTKTLSRINIVIWKILNCVAKIFNKNFNKIDALFQANALTHRVINKLSNVIHFKASPHLFLDSRGPSKDVTKPVQKQVQLGLDYLHCHTLKQLEKELTQFKTLLINSNLNTSQLIHHFENLPETLKISLKKTLLLQYPNVQLENDPKILLKSTLHPCLIDQLNGLIQIQVSAYDYLCANSHGVNSDTLKNIQHNDKVFSELSSLNPLDDKQVIYNTSLGRLQATAITLPELKADFTVTMVGAEYKGLYKIGGLGEAINGLSRGIKEEHPNATVRLIYPKFSHLDSKILIKLNNVVPEIHTNNQGKQYKVYQLEEEGIQCSFIEDPSFELLTPINKQENAYIYDAAQSSRFATFSSLAADLIHKQGTDVLHLHDWHVAGVALALQKNHPDEWKNGTLPAVVFTFHNNMRAAQGRLDDSDFIEAGITDTNDNLFILALKTADMVTTVSKRFGEEAQEKLLGEGISFAVRDAAKLGKVVGIINGITPDDWNPEKNKPLMEWKNITTKEPLDLSYGPDSDITSQKQKSKDQLQQWITKYLPKVTFDCSKPIITFVGRLCSYQKGIDKFEECIEAALKEGAQFICMGIGEDDVSKSILNRLEKKYKQGVLFLRDHKQTEDPNKGKLFFQQGILNTDNTVQRPGIGSVVRAATDFGYVPSSFEPCGLVQFEGWMFGALTIGSNTGGLIDTIDEDKNSEKFNGFLFERQGNSNKSASHVVQEAIRYWKGLSPQEKNTRLKRVMENAKNSSWATPPDALSSLVSPVKRYIEVYQHAIHRKKSRTNQEENHVIASLFNRHLKGETKPYLSKVINDEKYLAAFYNENHTSEHLVKLYKDPRFNFRSQVPMPYGKNVNFTTHEQFGSFLKETSVYFSTLAPQASHVHLVLLNADESISSEQSLTKNASGKWELTVPGLKEGQCYQFRVDGKIVSDPYARAFTPTKTNPSNPFISCVTASSHAWNDAAWVGARPAASKLKSLPLNIHEIHPALWEKRDGQPLNYRDLSYKLASYCKKQNYTHVELMGILEHPCEESWGYQVSGYFSPSHRMGTPDDFKFLVDHLHQNGIGVVLDWVPAHFAKGDFGLDPYFKASGLKYSVSVRKHAFGYGSHHFDFSKKDVREFLISSAYFWLKEMHIDGLRVDCVRSLLSTEDHASAELFIKDLNHVVHSKCPGAFTIAEEYSGNTDVSRPLHHNGYNFDMRYNVGWKGITIGNYFTLPIAERSKHYDTLKGILESDKGTPNATQLLFIGHDEVKGHDEDKKAQASLFLKTPGISDIDERHRNLKTLLSFMTCFPGKKLNFMGNELASSTHWNTFLEWDKTLNQRNPSGLMDSTDMEDPRRKQLLTMQAELNHIYQTKKAFHEFDQNANDLTWIDDPAKVIHAFRRHASDGSTFACFHNFSQQEESITITIPKPKEGTQVILPKEIFNSNHTEFGEEAPNSGLVSTHEAPTHTNYTVKVPPLTAIIVEECKSLPIPYSRVVNLTENKKIPLLQKIKAIAIAIFKAIVWLFTFPLRYIGSKSWSIPGVILRTPLALFRKIFGKNVSLKEQLFKSGYQSRFQKELSPDDTAKLLPYGAITAFVHNGKTEWLTPFGFKSISPITLPAIPEHASLKAYEHSYLDSSSGLKVGLSEKEDEIVIGFGALESYKSILGEKSIKNTNLRTSQVVSVIKNIFGLNPAIYEQAASFVDSLLKLEQFKGKKITLTGTSFGGSIASYVALKHRHSAYCFNSLPLGPGLQDALPRKNLIDAEELVTHLSVYNDYASDSYVSKLPDLFLSSLGLRTPGNFGKRFVIPTPYKNFKEKHEYMVGSMMTHLGYTKRTNPHEIGSNHPLINYLKEHQNFDSLPQNVKWQLKFATNATYEKNQIKTGKLFNLDLLTFDEINIIQKHIRAYYETDKDNVANSVYPYLLDHIEKYKARV